MQAQLGFGQPAGGGEVDEQRDGCVPDHFG